MIDRIFNRVISAISVVLIYTTLIISDSIVTISPVEFLIVLSRLFPLY